MSKQKIKTDPPLSMPLRLVLFGILTLIGLVIAAGFVPFSHPRLTARVRADLLAAGCDSCSIGRVTLTPFIGIGISELYVRKRVDASSRLAVTIPHLKADYRLVEILVNWPQFNAGVRQLVNTELRPDRFNLTATLQRADSLLFPYIWRFSCQDSRICQVQTSGLDTLGEDVSCYYVRTKEKPLTLQLGLDALKLHYGVFRLAQPSFEVEVRDGKVLAKKVTARIGDGRLRGVFDINLAQQAITSGSFSLKKIDLASLHGLSARKVGTVAGMGSLEGDLRPAPLCLPCTKARGTFNFHDVYVNRIPLLNTVTGKLCIPALQELTFKSLTGDFYLLDGQVACENVKARGEPMNIDASGWIEPAGYFRFKVEGTLAASFKPQVDPLIWSSMVEAKDGDRKFFCTFSGTFDDPTMTIDPQHTQRAVRNVLKLLGGELRNIFR
jgi:hypothetical protein